MWSPLLWCILSCSLVGMTLATEQWNPYEGKIQRKALNSIKSDEQLDKEAFYTLLDKLLWNDNTIKESSSGRQFMRNPYKHRGGHWGLFGRPKPVMFKRADSLPGSLYRSFADQCYGILCSLGLSGLAQSIVNLI